MSIFFNLRRSRGNSSEEQWIAGAGSRQSESREPSETEREIDPSVLPTIPNASPLKGSELKIVSDAWEIIVRNGEMSFRVVEMISSEPGIARSLAPSISHARRSNSYATEMISRGLGIAGNVLASISRA